MGEETPASGARCGSFRFLALSRLLSADDKQEH